MFSQLSIFSLIWGHLSDHYCVRMCTHAKCVKVADSLRKLVFSSPVGIPGTQPLSYLAASTFTLSQATSLCCSVNQTQNLMCARQGPYHLCPRLATCFLKPCLPTRSLELWVHSNQMSQPLNPILLFLPCRRGV